MCIYTPAPSIQSVFTDTNSVCVCLQSSYKNAHISVYLPEM